MEKEGQGARLEDLGLLFWLEEVVDAILFVYAVECADVIFMSLCSVPSTFHQT